MLPEWPTVKVSVILRLISRDGWYLDRQRGSHR
jgi:predicted RNA binding protein YcfA (HicA-like mRNA interferase family)